MRPNRTPSGAALAAQRQGLVAWWPLSEPTGNAAFNTITGKSSALTGATWKPQHIGYCLNFSGSSQYVSLGQTTLAGSATLSLWVNATTWANGGAFGVNGIFGRGQWGSDGNGDIRVITYDFGGTAYIRFQVYTSGGDTQAMIASNAYPTNTWHHITAVYDESQTTLNLYINGVLAATGSSSGTMSNVAKNFAAGAYNNNEANTGFNGKVADLRVYNRALQAGEVRALWAPETRWQLYETSRVLWIPTVSNDRTGTSDVTAAPATIAASGTIVNAYTGSSAVAAAAATMAASGTITGAAARNSHLMLLGVG